MPQYSVLALNMQEHYNRQTSANTLGKDQLVQGHLYAIFVHGQWSRAKVLNKGTLSLVDIGLTVNISEVNYFRFLVDEFRRLPGAVVKARLSGLRFRIKQGEWLRNRIQGR